MAIRPDCARIPGVRQGKAIIRQKVKPDKITQ